MFSISLITPAVVSLFDGGKDIAFFIDMNEEGDNQGNETAKDLEIKIKGDTQKEMMLTAEKIMFLSKKHTMIYCNIF